MYPDSSKSLDATTILVPSFDPEATGGLIDIRDGSQDILEQYCSQNDIKLRAKKLFAHAYKPGKDLPSDLVLFFAEQPNDQIAQSIIATVLNGRFEVMRLISVMEGTDAWLRTIIHAHAPDKADGEEIGGIDLPIHSPKDIPDFIIGTIEESTDMAAMRKFGY